MSELSRKEKEILNAFDSGKLKRAAGSKESLHRHRECAKATEMARMNAETFDREFDAGGDITYALNLASTRRPNRSR